MFYKNFENNDPGIFRNWNRKGYSLFKVIKKVVVIGVLPIVYHSSAEAQSTDIIEDTVSVAMEFELDEIEVSSQLAPVTFSDAARMITIIGRQEIEAAPAQSIQEMLEYIPGVDVRKRGGQGVQADISIRGSSFDQVMILLNGVDITDPQTGHHNLNLPVNLNQIERIEIIEGSASRVFGPNAFAGAINFITHSSLENRIKVNATAGQNGFLNTGISGSLAADNAIHYLSLGKGSSAGYIENTDFENNNIYYNVEFGKAGNLNYQLGYSDKSFGANSFYTPKYPDQYENIKVLFNALKWETNNHFHFTPTVYWRRHTDKFELFRGDSPDWYSGHNYHLTNTLGINMNGWIGNKIGRTAFGGNFRREKILSNVLGKDLENPVEIKNEKGEYIKSDSRNSYSIFLEHNISLEKLDLSAGIMANHISGIDKGIQIFPGVDISYEVNKNLKAYISTNKSMRAPTFTDLYYSGPTNTGNPDLLPETSSSIEGGIKINTLGFYGNMAIFYREIKNGIDWVRSENEDIWHTENHTRIASTGFELNFYYVPGKKFRKRSFITRIKGGYLFNSLSKKEDLLISRYALDNLKHKFNLSVTHNFIKSVTASWKINFQDRNGSYTDFENGSYASEKPYNAFALIDLKLNYKVKEAFLFLIISNIFDTDYIDFGNIVQPGRWIKIGASLDIKYK